MDPQAKPLEQPFVVGVQPTETTSLIRTISNKSNRQESDVTADVDQKWAQEVLAGDGETTWKNELLVMLRSGIPLTVQYSLEWSLTVASIFSIGHLGKTELGGITLGVMSANITGLGVFIGMSTSLDTLCSQAYGSGKKELVGIYVQRMLCVFAILLVPLSLLWWFSGPILSAIVGDKEVAEYASRYLRILILGSPGIAAFECGKRFMQAQQLFGAATWVMAICGPLNALMNWLFVWKFGFGYDGAAMAVVISETLLPIGLILYARFIAGRECWGGFSKKALSNWGPMIRLAIPGLVMLEAEMIAFDVLTFAASHFDTTTLAAQSVLHTIIATFFQLPFSLSVAGSNRTGNLVGATLETSAKLAAKVILTMAAAAGLINMILLSALRNQLPLLFNSDPDVVALAAHTLPVCATFQLFDSVAASCNGVLRGVGRQRIGGWVQLLGYYVVGIPVSMSTAFLLNWSLMGLWLGISLALLSIAIIELVYLRNLDWKKCIEAATQRNTMG